MPGIKKWPVMERPREKMWDMGPAALSNAELLSILIGSGTRNMSAVGLAGGIISDRDEGLGFLSKATLDELAEIPGIGRAIACRIAAASELGKRLALYETPKKIKVGMPEDIAAHFMEELRHKQKEMFLVLMLNGRNEVIGKELISIGNVRGAIVDPKDVFRPVIRKGAIAVALVHNHPSGDPSPSQADIDVTKQLIEASQALEITVLDHLIIGDGRFVSLKQEKLM